jgi:hypothetical protein
MTDEECKHKAQAAAVSGKNNDESKNAFDGSSSPGLCVVTGGPRRIAHH